MGNLFVAFDKTRRVFRLPLNWASACFSILLLCSSFWLANSQYSLIQLKLFEYIAGEFKAIIGQFCAPGSLWVSVSLFTFILLINFSGLLPYIFPARRHLPFAIRLAVPLWVGHIVFRWYRQPQAIFAHLVPLGTPGALIPFIVVIELIRSSIRPLTLSVRLVANIIAGHLLLSLLGNIGPNVRLALIGLIIGLIVLSLLETGVAVIQAYVFRALRTLYLREVRSRKILYI